jgi:hypothetical protein
MFVTYFCSLFMHIFTSNFLVGGMSKHLLALLLMFSFQGLMQTDDWIKKNAPRYMMNRNGIYPCMCSDLVRQTCLQSKIWTTIRKARAYPPLRVFKELTLTNVFCLHPHLFMCLKNWPQQRISFSHLVCCAYYVQVLALFRFSGWAWNWTGNNRQVYVIYPWHTVLKIKSRVKEPIMLNCPFFVGSFMRMVSPWENFQKPSTQVF